MAKKDEKDTKVVETVDEDFDVTKDEGKIRHDKKGLRYRGIKKGTDGVTVVYR
jgi:hypothetical protein